MSQAQSGDAGALLRWRELLWPVVIVSVGATLYALVVTWPLVTQLDRSIYGYPGDATGTVGVYEWWSFALRHGLSVFDNTAWGAPYGAGWQALPFTVIPVLVFGPLSALLGGTFAYNVQVLSSFPITAAATYLLARQAGARSIGAAFAAMAFAFVPYHLEKAQGHAGQAHMEFFPAALFFLLRWRQGGSRWNLAAAGAVAGLTLWNDYYFAYIVGFVIATFFVANLLWPSTKTPFIAWLRRNVAGGFIVALAAALFIPVALLAAARPGSGSLSGAVTSQVTGLHQGLDEVRIYTARPYEYLLPYHANPLLPDAVLAFEERHLHGSNFAEESLFIGYTVGVLALFAVWMAWRRFETALLLGVGVVGFLVALPPGVSVGSLVVPTPSLLLNPWFSVFRVYSRFGVLVLLGAAVLAGLGLTMLQPRLSGRRAALLALPFVLAAVEFNNVPPTHVTALYPAPAEYRWLASQPPGILIEYPLKAGDVQAQEVETRQYQLYQHVHGHPMFNGANPGSNADAMSSQLEPYYAPGVSQVLGQIGIRYVFVHRLEYGRDGFDLPANVPGLTYIQTLDRVDIYEVS